MTAAAVRLATWNIKHGWHPGTGRPDPDAFVAACVELGVDVLALQEVDRRTRRVGGADLLALAAAATGMAAVDGAVVDVRGGGTYGNALLVRGSASDVATLALPRRWWPPWSRPEPRGAVRCRIESADLVVATCHLGFDRGEGQGQLDATLRWLGATTAGPAVLLGDLNLRRPRVEPPWTLLAGVPKAFPADVPDRTIDHVVSRGDVSVRATPDAGRPVVSDHRPVVVELA